LLLLPLLEMREWEKTGWRKRPQGECSRWDQPHGCEMRGMLKLMTQAEDAAL
jgi:hypothetical protein